MTGNRGPTIEMDARAGQVAEDGIGQIAPQDKEWLTPRRREILAALDERGVKFELLGDNLASLRFYIHPEPGVPTSAWKVVDGRLRPVMNPGREPDSGEFLAELFNPEARRPIEYLDGYPDLLRKYCLASSVIEELENSAG